MTVKELKFQQNFLPRVLFLMLPVLLLCWINMFQFFCKYSYILCIDLRQWKLEVEKQNNKKMSW